MVDKILQRSAGVTSQYIPVTTSVGAGSSGKIPALGSDGKLDPSMYNPGADPTYQITAYEAIGAGKFYNMFVDSGVLKARLADNSNGRPAHGFVKASVAASGTGVGFPLDVTNSSLTGLNVGTTYFLGTAGGVIAAPLDAADPAKVGFIDQKIGMALSATELATDDYDYVVL